MALENATTINQLNPLFPVATDGLSSSIAGIARFIAMDDCVGMGVAVNSYPCSKGRANTLVGGPFSEKAAPKTMKTFLLSKRGRHSETK